MNRRIIITAISAIAIAALGCSKNNSPSIPNTTYPNGYELSSDSILFQTKDNWGNENIEDRPIARGTITNEFNQGDNIAVFAYYLPNGGTFDQSSSMPNFMYNQCVTKQSNNNWTYTPIKYWSNNPTDNYKFFAYSPYSKNSADDNNGIIISGTDVAGYPSVTYLPTPNATENASFMVAEPIFIKGKEETKEKIRFQFKHQLAELKFKFNHNGSTPVADGSASGDMVKIESIEIEGIRERIGKFCEKGADNLSFVWDNVAKDAATTTVTTSEDNGGIKSDFITFTQTNIKDRPYEDVTTDIGGMLLAPQNGFYNFNNTLELTVTFALIKSNNGTITKPMQAVQKVLFNPLDMLPAHTYALCFTLDVVGLEGVVLGGEVIREEWKRAGADYDFGDIE